MDSLLSKFYLRQVQLIFDIRSH